RKLAAARPDAFLPYLAGSLNNLGMMLRELGRREEALEAAREAVEQYVRLTPLAPARYLPELSIAVRSLVRHLENTEHDWRSDSLVAEAVALFERFTDQDAPIDESES
ncbi:MAG: tetratricopeptide repeat protein, partial [Phycisphaerae bacterium]|nr:tetratricopeptide repeat protein [Phycisphaerae bacterium]